MKNKLFQLLPIIALGLLVLAIPLSVYLLEQRQILRSKADREDVVLSFSPTSKNDLVVGSEAKFDIILNAKRYSISGYDVTVKFNPEVLEVVNFEPRGTLDTQIIPNPNYESYNNIEGFVRYVAVDKSRVGKSGIIPLGTITFKTLAETSADELSFDNSVVQVVESGGRSLLGTERGIASLAILGEPVQPALNNIKCSFLANGTGTQLILSGNNFGERGSQGSVKINGTPAEIIEWRDGISSPTPTRSATPSATVAVSPSVSSSAGLLQSKIDSEVNVLAATNTLSYVVVKVPQRVEDSMDVLLTLNDGRSAQSSCTVGVTLAEFSAKTQCRKDYTLENVEAVLIEDINGAKPILKKTVTIDSTGRVIGLDTKLETGKTYLLSLRAPRSIGIVIDFSIEEGTNEVTSITLPVGDIYGQGGTPDNVINAVDKAELVRQLNLVSDVARSADFNGDSRVNTIDYSCMKENIGKVGERIVY